MASKIIGRTKCPECDFEKAHVKQSEKCVYRYCPECGSQFHARTERQREALVKRMTPLGAGEGAPTDGSPTVGSSTPTDKATAPAAAPAVAPAPAPVPTGGSPTPTATAKPARRGLFSMGV